MVFGCVYRIYVRMNVYIYGYVKLMGIFYMIGYVCSLRHVCMYMHICGLWMCLCGLLVYVYAHVVCST